MVESMLGHWLSQPEPHKIGNFVVVDHGKKFEPGNPMLEDRFSMGSVLGGDSNIIFLYHQHENITDFQIVNMDTGDTLEIRLPK